MGNKDAITTYINEQLQVCQGQPIYEYVKLIHEKGQWFEGRELSSSYEPCKKFKKYRRPKMKECFNNAQLFILDYSKAEYYEGYMCDSDVVAHHAWVVMPDKKAVDFTIEARDTHMKKSKLYQERTEPPVYLGVHVPREFILKKTTETGRTQPIAHMYYLGSRMIFFD